ncbi:MAG: AzlD domain-containing protein [Clostridia bacterium]|nr:AzlD domain-containing protein [Clostridia bacterium]
MVIVGAAVVTYLSRMLPLVLLSRWKVPPIVERWLGFIPIAVLSSLLAPLLLMPQGHLDLTANNHYLLAALPTMVVAWVSQNLLITLVAGIIVMAVIQFI